MNEDDDKAPPSYRGTALLRGLIYGLFEAHLAEKPWLPWWERARPWAEAYPRLWAILTEEGALKAHETGWESRLEEVATALEVELAGEPHPMLEELRRRAAKHGLNVLMLRDRITHG